VIESTALLEFGYADGREDAMSRLLAYLIGRTHELGRQDLMAPLDQLPALQERMASSEQTCETRSMSVDVFPDTNTPLTVTVRKPYTDLAYW
jgi:hypothetical protein